MTTARHRTMTRKKTKKTISTAQQRQQLLKYHTKHTRSTLNCLHFQTQILTQMLTTGQKNYYLH